MRAWRHNTAIMAITIFVPLLSREAIAQNLLLNPHFDATLDNWGASTSDTSKIFWTPDLDHDAEGTGHGGSVHLNTSTTQSFVAQCVVVDPAVKYVASAWAYSGCTGHRFYVFWANQEDCADTGDFTAAFVKTTATDRWGNVSMVVTPPAGSSRAVVALFNPSGCADGVYFDDVMFEPDAIFANGFE